MGIHEAPVLYSVDLGGCDTLVNFPPDDLIAAFVAAMERAGATVVQTVSHAFPGGGLTSVLVLRESHAVLHTWPETGTVNIDVFSCTSRLKTREAVNEMRLRLGARQMSVQEIPRADGHAAGTPAEPRA
jgi:S-adenosylmethionine decarboxylase